MASTANESTPLISPNPSAPSDARHRNVTFNPTPTITTIDPPASSTPRTPSAYAHTPTPSANPMLSALNSKLRRRNSSGSTLPPPLAHPGPKIGPQRTTKNAQKLKLLPNPEFGDEGPEGESGRDGDVYSQYTRIKDPTARRDAARLGKADRSRLPRVTAYCTSNRYNMDGLVHFLKSRVKIRGANPKRFDECVYSPYSYSRASQKMSERLLMVHSAPLGEGREGERERERERRHSDSAVEVDGDASQSRREKLMQMREGEGGNGGENGEASAVQGNVNGDTIPSSDLPTALSHESVPALPPDTADFDTTIHTPEVFLFDYGVVVIWGMSLKDEQRFLKEIAKFETEKLAPDDVETENFNFYYTREYQARIYNDFITLREKGNYMTKLAISHALAQSVKTSLFEALVDNTIETCKDLPTEIALEGKISLSRRQINMQIGELFILRINIHLNGSVLDTPELFWMEPQLEPVYQAVRSYLEMDQRVGLLTERLDVIADLLAVLKDQLSHGHGEMLEWIVIVLIAAEILVAIVNIFVDLYAGVD